MTDEPKIGGIVVSAPLWNGATVDELTQIVGWLSAASYHFADDSGREWSRVGELKRQAAAEVNRLRLGVTAIEALYGDKPQLLGRDQFMDAILADARK